MKELSSKFFNILFEPGETICVSADKFAYHSVPQESLDESIDLLSPSEKVKPKKIKESDINLIAINPINGYRNDSNVTSYRSFLVELDDGSLVEQKNYIEEIGLPYSVCVFSGNKSLHYGISLDTPFPTIGLWRLINQWILNIVEKADQQTKNPSRGIRFPGNVRKDGKKKLQALVDIKGRVSQDKLLQWLKKFPEKEPIVKEPKRKPIIGGIPSLDKLSKNSRDLLESGVDVDRNKNWFNIGCELATVGFEIEVAFDLLEPIFEEENDFKRIEWQTCIKSAYKRVQGS